jgi:hypothetical protein
MMLICQTDKAYWESDGGTELMVHGSWELHPLGVLRICTIESPSGLRRASRTYPSSYMANTKARTKVHMNLYGCVRMYVVVAGMYPIHVCSILSAFLPIRDRRSGRKVKETNLSS